MKTILVGFAALLGSLTLFACDNSAHNGTDGTGGSGGTGGTGGGEPRSVLGTKQSGDCNDSYAFATACKQQGGVLGDNCQWANCTGEGVNATCFDPQPPGADEFSCDGLFNCQVSEVCRIKKPDADGCFLHECLPIPSECLADPTCDCVQTVIAAYHCAVDAEGNLTLTSHTF